MHLQGADGPHVIDGSLDSSLQGTSLTMTVHQNHYLTGIHHGANTDGKCVGRYILGLASEETTVGDTGISSQCLHSRTTAQRTARLVEGDMTIGADTSDEQVDTSSLLDHLLIMLTLSLQVLGITIQDVDILLRTVDMIEEVAGHEGMVTLGMGLGQTNILVHVKGNDILERYLTGTICFNEGIVHADGRRTSGKAQYKLVIRCGIELVDTLNDVVGCPLGQFLIVRLNNYSHNVIVLLVLNFCCKGTKKLHRLYRMRRFFLLMCVNPSVLSQKSLIFVRKKKSKD